MGYGESYSVYRISMGYIGSYGVYAIPMRYMGSYGGIWGPMGPCWVPMGSGGKGGSPHRALSMASVRWTLDSCPKQKRSPPDGST